MKTVAVTVAAALLLGVAPPRPAAAAQKQTRPAAASRAVTPAPGSAQRKAILGALRARVQKELKRRPVIFTVDHLRVQGDWAFMTGVPRQPGGKPMDYRGTVYEENMRHGHV